MNPHSVAADGRLSAGVTVRVVEDEIGGEPVDGVNVLVHSSRNQDDRVDAVEQPGSPTDSAGLAQALIGSSTLGEVEITATVEDRDGFVPLCARYDGEECVPATGTVVFYCPEDVDCCEDADCDDGQYCNGEETCLEGECQEGGNPCDDGVACTMDSCNEDTDSCDHSPDDELCQDDVFCNGKETCDPAAGCLPGIDPCQGGGECDGTCNEDAGNCFESAGTPCGDPTDTECDAADICDGAGRCLENLLAAGTPCTDTDPGDCSDAQCDGSGVCDQEYAHEAAGHTCRAAAGDCDVAETCDGTTRSCPDDEFAPASTECRVSMGACDQADYCDGLNPDCLPDALSPSTTLCRPPVGICDAAEYCTGQSPLCPPDVLEPAGTVCRASSGLCGLSEYCDPAEVCDGLTPFCPADVHSPPGTPCDDTLFCNGTDTCDGARGCTIHTGNPCAPQACDEVNDVCVCSVDADCDVTSSCKESAVCDPADPGADTDGCVYTRPVWWECLEWLCDGIDNDCDGCTDEGCGGDVVDRVKVIPYSSGPGLRRISGNGQFGPACQMLPNRLLVQLNDASGNPIPCEPITFAIEAAGTVCYGRGGTFNQSTTTEDPEILRACNKLEGGILVGGPVVETDDNGQASVGFIPDNAPGLTVVSATADSTGETVFFALTSVPRLSATLSLPDPDSPDNPAMGPLAARVGANPSRPYMADKANYTLTVEDLAASTGSTSGVPSAQLTVGGFLFITGTQFADSESVIGECGGDPDEGYPRVWIGGVEVSTVGVSDTQIVVPIPEGLPGAASVIVDDGTDTEFLDCSATPAGCLPSMAGAIANLWRVVPSGNPVFLAADTGTVSGSSVDVRLIAQDACGNALPLGGHSVSMWTENPDGSSPSTAVAVGVPDAEGFATVDRKLGGEIRSTFIMGEVDGLTTAPADMAVVTAVPSLRPSAFAEDPALGNDDGINSIMRRGGAESGGSGGSMEDSNYGYAFRTFDMTIYDINWLCTVGLIPACECPAPGVALTAPCGSAFETEEHMALATLTAEGDMRFNTSTGGLVATGGTSVTTVSGGYDVEQGGGGIMSVASGQVRYDIFMVDWFYDKEGVSQSGWLRQDGVEQEIEMFNTNFEIWEDFMDEDPSNDQIRESVFRALLRRSLP